MSPGKGSSEGLVPTSDLLQRAKHCGHVPQRSSCLKAVPGEESFLACPSCAPQGSSVRVDMFSGHCRGCLVAWESLRAGLRPLLWGRDSISVSNRELGSLCWWSREWLG